MSAHISKLYITWLVNYIPIKALTDKAKNNEVASN